MTSNLVWFPSDNSDHYLQFWKENIGEIFQQKRDKVPNYIQWLVDEKVIRLPQETKDKLEERFYDTAMKTLNICPEFGVVYTFTSSEAEQLDKKGKLAPALAEKIRESLKVVGIDGNDLLKTF